MVLRPRFGVDRLISVSGVPAPEACGTEEMRAAE